MEKEYLASLLEGNRKNAAHICKQYLQSDNSIKNLYEKVMKPALYEVGNLWEKNKISVAAEHLATAITEGILNSYYSQIIPEVYNSKKVVLACVEKEEHQVGIKMVADIFEMNQWESFFLGTGFPTSELIRYIDEIKPDLLAISLSVYFNFGNLKSMLKALQTAFPNLPILIGGQAVSYVSEAVLNEWSNVTYLSDLVQLEDFILKLKK